MLLKASTAALLLLVASTPAASARRPLKVSSVKACTTLVLGSFYTEECEGEVCVPATGCSVDHDPVKDCPSFEIVNSDVRYLYDCDDIANAPATRTLPRGLLTSEYYAHGVPTGRVAQLEPLGYIWYDDKDGQNQFADTNLDKLNQDILYEHALYAVNYPDYVWGSLSADFVASFGNLAYEGQAQVCGTSNTAGLVKKGDPFSLNLSLGGKSVGFKTNSTDGKRAIAIEGKTGYVLVSIVATLDYDDKGYNLLKESEVRYYKRKGKLHR